MNLLKRIRKGIACPVAVKANTLREKYILISGVLIRKDQVQIIGEVYGLAEKHVFPVRFISGHVELISSPTKEFAEHCRILMLKDFGYDLEANKILMEEV